MKISTPLPTVPAHSQGQNGRRWSAVAIAESLFSRQPSRPQRTTPGAKQKHAKVVCISDTHNSRFPIPDGDVLLHAGDLTDTGSFEEIQAQLDWLASLPHAHKISIAGNHDRLLDAVFVDQHPERILEKPGASRADLKWHDIVYLENSSTTFTLATPDPVDDNHSDAGAQQQPTHPSTLKIYGSPSTPDCGTFAFQYPPIRNVFQDKIPNDVDIVLVHGPPKGFLDLHPRRGHLGCPHLTRELRRVRPRLVVCGHIHSAAGVQDVRWGWTMDDFYGRIMGGDDVVETFATRARLWGLIFGMVVVFCLSWIQKSVHSVTGASLKSQHNGKNATIIVNAAMNTDDAIGNEAKVIYLQLKT